MSQWTHICGCIRIDGIPDLMPGFDDPIKKALGNTVDFDDEESKWDACNVPSGSEGSMQYQVITSGGENNLACRVVAVWGDLRDFSDVDEVKKWFDRVTQESKIMIRQAILEVRVEYGPTVILRYEYEKETTVITKEYTPEKT